MGARGRHAFTPQIPRQRHASSALASGASGPNYKRIAIIAVIFLVLAAILTVLVVAHTVSQQPEVSPAATVALIQARGESLVPTKDQGGSVTVSCPREVPAKAGTVFECIVAAATVSATDEFTFTMREVGTQGASAVVSVKPYAG